MMVGNSEEQKEVLEVFKAGWSKVVLVCSIPDLNLSELKFQPGIA